MMRKNSWIQNIGKMLGAIADTRSLMGQLLTVRIEASAPVTIAQVSGKQRTRDDTKYVAKLDLRRNAVYVTSITHQPR